MINIAKPNFGKEEEGAVLEVLRSGRLAQGPKVAEFEKNFAEYIGTKHAIAVSSGTAALELAIMAYDFPKGSEIITTPFTFISTANSIINNGNKPVFVDIDENTFNLNPDLIQDKITDKTKAIIPVHLFGQCANMTEINKIAQENNLIVIEDACQAHGAKHNNKKAGALGNVGCFSFYATKNMTTGEGGMVTTNNEKLDKKIKMLRNHGQSEQYKIELIGGHRRMTEMQAAIGIEQLKKLDQMNARRIEIADKYNNLLKEKFEVPYIDPKNKHVFHQYTLKLDNRNQLKQKLINKEIQTGIYYPVPIHLQQPYIDLFGYSEGDFHVAEKLSKKVLSLPMHSQLTDDEIQEVISALTQ